jgi:hypothetical protein
MDANWRIAETDRPGGGVASNGSLRARRILAAGADRSYTIPAMALHTALAFCTVLAAAYLVVATPSRLLPFLALLAGVVELAMALGWLRLAVNGPNLSLALGVAIALPALVIWWRAGGKGPLSAAAVLAFIGMLQTTLAIMVRV